MGAFVGCMCICAVLWALGEMLEDRLDKLIKIFSTTPEDQAQNLIDQAKGKS